MNAISDLPPFLFARWDADDALDALHQAGLNIDHVQQAQWPARAPQPRTQRQAFTFRSSGVVDPHLLLIFDSAPALEAWRLWLVRYWKARPYLSIHDNVLLLVSRDLSEHDAVRFHEALVRLGQPLEPGVSPSAAPPASAPVSAPMPTLSPEPAGEAEHAAAPTLFSPHARFATDTPHA